MTSNEIKANGVSYRLQTRKCYRQGCKCMRGEEHGPYWYAFDGMGTPKYIGAKLPEHVLKFSSLLKASGPKLKTVKQRIIKRREDLQRQIDQANEELRTLHALEVGERADLEILKSLGFPQFVNGKG